GSSLTHGTGGGQPTQLPSASTRGERGSGTCAGKRRAGSRSAGVTPEDARRRRTSATVSGRARTALAVAARERAGSSARAAPARSGGEGAMWSGGQENGSTARVLRERGDLACWQPSARAGGFRAGFFQRQKAAGEVSDCAAVQASGLGVSGR